MTGKIRAALANEPLVAALGTLVVAVLGVLGATGTVTAEDAEEVVALAPYAGLLIAWLRSKVTPAAKAAAELRRAEAGIPRH